MITRQAILRNLEEVFFPVEEEPISWGNFMGTGHHIPGYKAIVDVERGKTLSVVSRQYRLVLNQEAYQLADHVIRVVFKDKTIHDFECYNIYMPASRASCRIDLIIPNSYNKLFGNDKESWTPFVRISNSYNKTSTLKFEIGFCRWICMNGVIFGQIGISFSLTHTSIITPKEITRLIESARIRIGNIESIWQSFEKKMAELKEIQMPISVALAIYCKVFGVVAEEGKVTEAQKEVLAMRAKQTIRISKEYFKELGNNAYAMMNVLTDAATFPEWTNNITTYIDSYQRRVGKWVDIFLNEHKKKDFNLTQYIGEDYLNTAFYLESLVPEE